MSRLYDALHRASQADEPTTTAPADLSHFTVEEGAAAHSNVIRVGTPRFKPHADAEPSAEPSSPAAGAAVEASAAPEAHPVPPPMPSLPPSTRASREYVSPPPRPQYALPAPAMAQQPTAQDVALRDVLRILASRWKLIACVVAASTAFAAGYNALATRLYEAHSRLLLDVDQPQVVPFNQERDTTRLDYYVTQLEVLRSPNLAKRALEKLGTLNSDQTQQGSQVAGLMRTVTVSPVKSDMGESRVINISVRSADPRFAAQFANGLAQAYVDQNLDIRRQGSLEASAWLNDRLAELRSQVTAREGALQQYREQKDAVSLDDHQNIVVQKLAQLSAAVTAARTERVEKEAMYEQLTNIEQRGDSIETFPPIMSSTFIQGLKAELASLQRERAQLAEHLGDLHPDMIKVNTAIEGAQRRLNAEMQKVIEGVKNDYRAAQAKERGLVAALEDQKREVLSLNQKSIGYSALQRDATSTQQIFDSVLQRVKETDLAAQLKSNNARILDPAEVPHGPVWPKPGLNLAIALLGGLFLGIAAAVTFEYFNPSIETATDLEQSLGLPVLGTAPRVAVLKRGSTTPDQLPPEFQEAMRGIATRIVLSPMAATARTLSVTSASSGEGKTVVATSLASSLALAGRRVLLIDADMRRPQVHNTFGIPKSPGLSDILAEQVKAPAAVRESGIAGLSIIAAGEEHLNIAELLSREALSALTDGFGDQFDVIVLDCPPVMAVADASIIANAASAVVFVVARGTTRELAQAAVERLSSVQASVVGVVLSKARRDRRYAYEAYLYRQPGIVESARSGSATTA